MITQQDVIKKFMATLDKTTAQGEVALDGAISASSSFTSYKSLLEKIISDCKAVNDADKFLKTYCGIDLYNKDTGAISGADAGGDLIKTAESVFPEEGELINFTGNEFTANGLTVKLGKTKGSSSVARNFSDLSTQETYLWQSIYTWWMNGSLDLIAESYGKNYGFSSESSAVTKTVWIIFNNTGKGTLAATAGGPAYSQKCTNDLDLYINMYYYSKATGENGKPDNGQAYLDRTLAHELTHAVMWANIDYFDHLPAFIKEGMAELTHGIDDVRTDSIENLAGNSTKLNQSLVLSKKTVNVSGISSASYAGGYIFLRYMAHQNADYNITNDTASTSIQTFFGNDTITNSASNVTISTGGGNDSIIGGGTNNFYIYSSGNDTVKNFGATDTLSVTSDKFYRETEGNDIFFRSGDGFVLLKDAANLSTLNVMGNEVTDAEFKRLTLTNSNSSIVTSESLYKVVDASARTKAVQITGNSLNNSIVGGSGNDILSGLTGNDTLTGGKGNDVFIYSAGDDVITDYGLGSDKISVSTVIENFRADGDDFIFNFGSAGSLTLKDSVGKKFSVVSSGTTQIYGDSGIFNKNQTAITLSAPTKNFTADSKLVSIDASLTEDATIIGNAKANKITFGDGSNVLIWSKGGNDTLENFGTEDLISVKGAVSDGSVKGGNTFLKIGSNKITFKDSAQIYFEDDGGKSFFDSGTFYSADKISATLGSAVSDFNAVNTDITAVTGNTKANKFYTGAGSVTLTGGKGNDTFFCGGNDFITDYGNGTDKISLSSEITNVSVNGKDLTLGFDAGNVTLAGGADKKISIVSGGKTNVNLFTNNGTFNTSKTAVTLSATVKDFTADSKLITIDASLTDGATVTGNSKANRITFGDGADVLIWSKGGNDTLENFGAEDLISVKGALVNDGSISGGNAFLRVGTNKVTFKDSAQVAIEDDDGEKFFENNILYGAGKTSATLCSVVDNFNATGTNVTSVNGNGKANKLYANEAADTTLIGGKGDDSLWGSEGVDTFIYTASTGTDKIFNYEDGELLQILNVNGSAGSFKQSDFANNSLTLSINGGGKVVFQNVASSTEFNINGKAYQVESARLVSV